MRRAKLAKKPQWVCLCNEVQEQIIRTAIRSGAKTLDEIFDSTSAGVGPCGGSCRPKLQILLDEELKKINTK